MELNPQLTKYEALFHWLRDNIENNTFKTGEKLISENQLCEKFSISRQTVRGAIAELEKAGYVTRVRGSGTYINQIQGEKKTPTRNIGVLTSMGDYIFPSIVSGIEEVLSENNYHMTMRLTRNKVQNERTQLLSLLDSNIDGLIVEGTKTALPNPNLDIYQKFERQGIPVLFINAYYHSVDCNYVVNDDVRGGYLATEKLIQLGHSKIGGIFKHDDLQGVLRYKGFLDAMLAQELTVDDNLMIWYNTESWEEVFSAENLPYLLGKLKQCTAILCYHDELALKLLQLLQNSEIQVPQDLSIISFDNSNLAEMSYVPLTSVTHPHKDLGMVAAKSMLTMLENPHFKVKHVFEPELVERDSAVGISNK